MTRTEKARDADRRAMLKDADDGARQMLELCLTIEDAADQICAALAELTKTMKQLAVAVEGP